MLLMLPKLMYILNERINDATAIMHDGILAFIFFFSLGINICSWLSNVTGLLLDVGAGKLATELTSTDTSVYIASNSIMISTGLFRQL